MMTTLLPERVLTFNLLPAITERLVQQMYDSGSM
jgi:hypothetical protein